MHGVLGLDTVGDCARAVYMVGDLTAAARARIGMHVLRDGAVGRIMDVLNLAADQLVESAFLGMRVVLQLAVALRACIGMRMLGGKTRNVSVKGQGVIVSKIIHVYRRRAVGFDHDLPI